MRQMVFEYIEKYVEEEALTAMYVQVMKTFPGQYGKVPDIAIFDEIRYDWAKDKELITADYKVGGYIPEHTVDPVEAAEGFAELWKKIGGRPRRRV